MIKSISLRNFQVHQDLKLEFTKGLNVLIGPTDAGKSAVIRALRLILSNQPRGGEKIYLTDGATEPLKITVEDWDGNVIERESRSYRINGDTVLTAFKTDLPEAVAEVVRISPVNYQAQIDPHFLILETGGNAAKILNTVTGMEDQMLVMSEVKSRMEATRRKHKDLSSEKESIAKKINELALVPQYLARLRKIQEGTQQLGELSNSIAALQELISTVEDRREQFESMRFLDELELRFRKIFAKAQADAELTKSIEALKTLVTSAEQGQEMLASLSDLTRSDLHCAALQKLAIHANGLEIQITELAKLITTIEKAEQQSQTLDFRIDDYRLRFNQLMKEAGKCPLCGSITPAKGV